MLATILFLSAILILKKKKKSSNHNAADGFYVNQIEQLKLQNQLLRMKNDFIESKRVTDGDLRLLRKQNQRIEKEIEILRKQYAVKSNTSEKYNEDENNKTFDCQLTKCDVTNQSDVINATSQIYDDKVKIRRQRFGQLRRTLSSTSIPSEHDDENTEYIPLVNKTQKFIVNDDKDKEVFKYLDSLPSLSSANSTRLKNNVTTSNRICESSMTTKKIDETGFIDQADILLAATQQQVEDINSKTPTTDDDKPSKSTATTHQRTTTLPMATNSQHGSVSCSRLQIPRITITDTVAAFYHFENATDQQSSVYMNEE